MTPLHEMCTMLHMNAASCTSSADLLTTAEVAVIVGRTVATVNRWAATGRLPVAAQANGRVFRRSDVASLVNELAGEAEATAARLRGVTP